MNGRDFSCRDCKQFDGFGYMVTDEVWVYEAGLPRLGVILCLECLSTHLKRPLNPHDFKLGPPVNDNIFYGLLMAGQPQWWVVHKEARSK